MKMLKILLVSALFSPLVHSDEQTGQVLEVRVTSKVVSNHHTHVKLSGVYSSAPGCIDQNWKFWPVDTDTPHGKSMLSAILTAKASGAELHFFGTGSCHPDEPGPNGMANLIQIGYK